MKTYIKGFFTIALVISAVVAQGDYDSFWGSENGPQGGNLGQNGNFGPQGGNFGPQGGNFGPQGGNFGPQGGNFGPQGGNQRPQLQPQPRPPTTPVPPRSTTQSLGVQNCVAQCPTRTTSEYNPVCGSNGVQYQNVGRLDCARRCGVAVQVATRATCNPVT